MTHISREGRAYQKAVGDIRARGNLIEITEFVSLEINLNPPDRRRRDVDNVLKALLDGLQKGGVLRDDNQVEELTIRRLEPVKGGRCSVRITPRTQAA